MKYNIYFLRDTKANTYAAPVTSHNKGVLIRDLSRLIAEKGDQPWQKYPSDFELFEAGTVDLDSGIFETYPPVYVLRLSELVEG